VFPFLPKNAQNSPQSLTKVSSWMTPKGKMGEQEATQYVGFWLLKLWKKFQIDSLSAIVLLPSIISLSTVDTGIHMRSKQRLGTADNSGSPYCSTMYPNVLVPCEYFRDLRF
jgi:hypothetical protein